MKKHAERCPVCYGRGFVQNGFYSSTADTWLTSTTGVETCRSCMGKGYVEVYDDTSWNPYCEWRTFFSNEYF